MAGELDAHLHPRVLSAVRQYQPIRIRGLRRRPWPVFGCWGLLVLEDGGLLLHPSGAADPVPVPEGSVVLGQPGRIEAYSESRLVRYRRIEFDVVPRPLQPQPRQPLAWMPSGVQAPQPDAVALWGVALPLLLPESLHAASLNLAREITDRWWQGRRQQNHCDLLLAGWLARVHERFILDEVTDASSPDPVLRAEAIARRDYATGITVADLARAVGMSKRSFHRHYLDTRGEGPGAFLIRMRYAEAQRLLADTPMPIAELARRTGFRSVSAFTAGFRQREGLTPTQWRQRRASG
jgi:AraC-like DNA-binding protein